MKTKIIYISGSDVFEIADIRAAFSEVRNTLGLDSDTVLFGVPVDVDDAGINAESFIQTTPSAIILDQTTDTVEFTPQTDITDNQDIANTVIDSEPVPAPKKAVKRAPRAKAKETDTTDEPVVVETIPAPVSDEKIIPILSILASKSEHGDFKYSDTDIQPESITEDIDIQPEEILSDIQVINVMPEPESVDEDAGVIESVVVERVTISDSDFESDDMMHQDNMSQDTMTGGMITDDAPVAEQEKTLEQLLENMAPLREDRSMEDIDTDNATAEEMDTDATLAQLASEFAEKQDEIVSTPKVETSGKIGKLKNILPFKKAKRDDTGLMGDLFGWAGIAANDDEFSIPGFFTTTASKK